MVKVIQSVSWAAMHFSGTSEPSTPTSIAIVDGVAGVIADLDSRWRVSFHFTRASAVRALIKACNPDSGPARGPPLVNKPN